MHAEGECVWANFLSVTGKESRARTYSLSDAQHQEVWVQYSALQIALQVRTHLWALVRVCVSPSLSSWSHILFAGLSSESKEPPSRHVHLRVVVHSSIFLIFLSGNMFHSLCCNINVVSSQLLMSFDVFFSRSAATLTHTMDSCPWSRPS